MTSLRLLFEFVPIILAIIAIPIIAQSSSKSIWVNLSATVSCILLIFTQTGFIQAVLTNSDFNNINKVWTIFNSLVMLVFIQLFRRP